MTDYTELRAIAEAANQGAFEARRFTSNLTYLAAFNPVVTLGLLDKLERYEEVLHMIWDSGHNDDCLFCGFKDRLVKAALNPTEAKDG